MGASIGSAAAQPAPAEDKAKDTHRGFRSCKAPNYKQPLTINNPPLISNPLRFLTPAPAEDRAEY